MLIPHRIRVLMSRCRAIFSKVRKVSDFKRWSDNSKLLPQWDSRTELISSFITNGMSVLEFGAGRMMLKKYLGNDCKYTPSDLVDRGNDTIVCDLNAKELPNFPIHDVAVFGGVLEYIFDVPRLVRHLYKSVNLIIASYAPTDAYPDRLIRHKNGWVNEYNMTEFKNIFEEVGFHCDRTSTWESQIICRFVKVGQSEKASGSSNKSGSSNNYLKMSLVAIRSFNYLPLFGNRIGYTGWIGHGNLGDEAMYKAIRKVFHHYHVLPYRHAKKMQILEKIMKKRIYKFVMLGGGTLINTREGEYQLREAQKLNYPTVVFGSGVRNPEFWDRIPGESNLLSKWIPLLEQCEFVGVRGPISQSILEQYGFHKAEVIGDPSLLLAQPKIVAKVMNKKLGLNIGISYGKIWGKEEKVLDFIVNFAQIMANKGWEITFVPVWDQDLPYIKEAMRRINRNVKIFLKYKSLQDTLRCIESCDIFIGEKLHSVALACCTYTPSIMLEYRPKCRDFMASLDLQKYNVRTDCLDNEHIITLCNELYENNSLMQQYIYNRVIPYQKKIQDSAVLLQKSLGL